MIKDAEAYEPWVSPYEEAEPVMTCPECGEPIYDGDKLYYAGDICIGCEHCIEMRLA